jgi:glycosyltransferase involved in cell wall biosynthesis
VTIPSISVVIPVKDDAANLEHCLAALIGQLDPRDELVVVDNGSTDGSAEVAARFDARIVDVSGGGIPAASAAGYDAATRTIIARLDADCVPGADWLATIRREFDARPDLVAVTGPARFLDGPRALRHPLAVLYLGAYYSSLLPALGSWPIFGSNCAFTRVAWVSARTSVHRGDPEVHDDLDLSFHLPLGGRVRFSHALVMGISMRPMFDGGALAKRFRRGAHTVVIHWPHDLPWRRWWRRVTQSTI